MTYPAISILGRNNKLDSDEDVGGIDCMYPRSASSRSLEDVHDDGANLIRAHVPKASHGCGRRHTDGVGGRHFFYLRFLRLNIAERTGRALDKLVIVHKADLLRERGCRVHDDCRRNAELALACSPHTSSHILWDQTAPYEPANAWMGRVARLSDRSGWKSNLESHPANVRSLPLLPGDTLSFEATLSDRGDGGPAPIIIELELELRWHSWP